MRIPSRDPSHAPRTMLALVLVVLVTMPQACRPKRESSLDRAIGLVRAGRHAEAIDVASQDPADLALADLRTALLCHQGRTLEAMDAYLSRPATAHDALLLEDIILSSFAPEMRPDPLLVVGARTERPPAGWMTAQAIDRTVDLPPDTLVPETRLVDLVDSLGAPGKDAPLADLERLVAQREHPALRRAALVALARIGTAQSTALLGRLAESYAQSQLMLRQILDAMATNPAAGAAVAAALLESPHEAVRSRAAGVLRHSTDPAASALLAASGRPEAMAALIGREEAPAGTAEKLEATWNTTSTALDRARFVGLLRETAGPGTVPLACLAAVSTEPGVAIGAVQLLSFLGHPSAGACLVSAASSEDRNVRLAALRALVDVPATDRMDELEALLEDALAEDSPTEASLAVAAVGRAGTQRAVTLLSPLLESESEPVRASAAVTLYHLGRDETRPQVEEVFENKTGPWEIYAFFEWRLLASHPDERTLPLLDRAVVEGNPSLRDKVLEAMVDRQSPEAIFMMQSSRVGRTGATTLEAHGVAEGKVSFVASQVLDGMQRDGDAKGRTELLGRLLASGDDYLGAVALRHMRISDQPWAGQMAREVMTGAADPWFRLEAVRCLYTLCLASS